jgi:PRTRC genetic system ThiF family protein
VNLHFDAGRDIREIFVVGLGGTGSQWARSICRMVYDMRTRRMQTPSIVFIDPDKVEMKNVGRQMFTVGDVGQYKAEVLAKRFNAALGLHIIWRNAAFHASMTHHGYGALICGAVDNHNARQAIADARQLWIDAGNHFDSGQVIIGNSYSPNNLAASLNEKQDRQKLEKLSNHGVTTRLPAASLVFPQLLEPEPKAVPQQSCADLVQFGEQHILINEWVANVAATYTYKLLYRQPIESYMTYIDAGGMNVSSRLITREVLQEYSKEAA